MADTTQQTPSKGIFSPMGLLVVLAAGLLLGVVTHQTQLPVLVALQDVLQPLGQMWLRALQMIVFPLVIVSLIVAILDTSDASCFGRLGATTLVMFVLYLVAGGLFALVVGGPTIELIPVDPNAEQILESFSERAAELAGIKQQQPSFGAWLIALVPVNPFAALSAGQLLPALVFTIVFALALTRVSTENRDVVQRFFRAVSQAMLVIVGWILLAAPVGVFALSAAMATGLGTGAVSALVQYVVLMVSFLLGATLLLYPLTAVFGGVSISHFARGVLPVQIVAFSTRSSLASLPSLLECAQHRLQVLPGIANLALPLSVSMFKVNRTITSTLKLLFIAHLFSIDISMGQTVTFIFTIIILSFGTPGIPLGGGGVSSIPAYVAAGIPIEAYILFNAVESIPDIFKTVVNVTCNMSVAVIVNRFFKRGFEEAAREETVRPVQPAN